jgi:hypothetical protein
MSSSRMELEVEVDNLTREAKLDVNLFLDVMA